MAVIASHFHVSAYGSAYVQTSLAFDWSHCRFVKISLCYHHFFVQSWHIFLLVLFNNCLFHLMIQFIFLFKIKTNLILLTLKLKVLVQLIFNLTIS